MTSKRSLIVEGLDDRLSKLNSLGDDNFVGKEKLIEEAKKALKSVESKYKKDVEKISFTLGILLEWEEQGYPQGISKFVNDLGKPYKGFKIELDMNPWGIYFNGDGFVIPIDIRDGSADFVALDMFEMDSESIQDYIDSIKGFEKGFPSFKANFEVRLQEFTSSGIFIPMEKKIRPKAKELMNLALKIEELKDKNSTMKNVYKEMLNIKTISKGIQGFYLQFVLSGELVLKLMSPKCTTGIICRSDNRGGVVIDIDGVGSKDEWFSDFIAICYHFEKVFDIFEKEFYKWFDKL